MKFLHSLFIIFIFSKTLFAESKAIIDSILIEGNTRVENDAILNKMSSKKGEAFDSQNIEQDLKKLFKLGYFSDIRFYKVQDEKGQHLKVKVVEKPAIASIKFQGLKELEEDDFSKTLDAKVYTIIDEGAIRSDLEKIEKKYAEKGFYLAKADYSLIEKSKNEVDLVFNIDEKGKVLVGDVHILGNKYFSNSEIIEKLASKPHTRLGAFGSGSLFQNDFLRRDVEFLSFYYKDHGFANVKVENPVVEMDSDQKFVRLTFQVQEGLQYDVGSISVSEDGDTALLAEKDLVESMALKSKALFKYTKFVGDIESLIDKYGDLGYAYVDVNPRTKFNDETKTVDIDYQITKGEKVYFGQILIAGNTKTRDNVVRREFLVHESELYSGTKLTKSKQNINRLGFFDEVQVMKERREDMEDVVDLKVKVKEKSTGQVQASLGYSPGGAKKQSWFGQGRYEEKNQSGRAWTTSVLGRYANDKDWDIELGFADPKVYDSPWSFGISVAEKRFIRIYTSEVEVPESQSSIGVSVGRDLIELIRASITLRHSYTKQLKDVFIFDDFVSTGVKNTAVFSLSRKDLDNNLDPTSGTMVNLSHSLNGGPLKGNFHYMETLLDTWYYHPLDFSEDYRTHFRVRGVLGKLWSLEGRKIPGGERYRLGGFENLRGYPYGSVGPKERRRKSSLNSYYDYFLGGDKEIYFQLEYIVPLIPKAGIKAVFFADAGRAYKEEEALVLKDLKKDVGFGLRWLTPIAPFRFEWAYPYIDEKGTFGDVQFIFTLGY